MNFILNKTIIFSSTTQRHIPIGNGDAKILIADPGLLSLLRHLKLYHSLNTVNHYVHLIETLAVLQMLSKLMFLYS